MQLFHGTRKRFENFDVAYRGTGESGDIAACWFTDNFKGASIHALLKNRNPGAARVYRCELKEGAIIADHSRPLTEQPDIAACLKSRLPLSIQFGTDRNWFALNEPLYARYRGRTTYAGNSPVDTSELIRLYLACGIQGVYDWEREFTDSYLHGITTVIFDTTAVTIIDDIEYGTANWNILMDDSR